MEKKKKRKPLRIILGAVILVALITGGMAYLRQYYPATEKAKMALVDTKEVEVTETKEYFQFEPKTETNQGIIFYPGGKVEETAYAPLMKELAKAGYEVYLMRMPFHLAVFDMNAADVILEAASDDMQWTMMGHSLGGAMAAAYTAKHTEQISQLVLLGAYSTKDLSDSNLTVLSIYGSEDGVMNRAKYERYKKNLPDDTIEYVIDGGNHAGYGYYGEQRGDGTAQIKAGEQQQAVVDLILHNQRSKD